jgi:hypothetical protein
VKSAALRVAISLRVYSTEQTSGMPARARWEGGPIVVNSLASERYFLPGMVHPVRR